MGVWVYGCMDDGGTGMDMGMDMGIWTYGCMYVRGLKYETNKTMYLTILLYGVYSCTIQ